MARKTDDFFFTHAGRTFFLSDLPDSQPISIKEEGFEAVKKVVGLYCDDVFGEMMKMVEIDGDPPRPVRKSHYHIMSPDGDFLISCNEYRVGASKIKSIVPLSPFASDEPRLFVSDDIFKGFTSATGIEVTFALWDVTAGEGITMPPAVPIAPVDLIPNDLDLPY